MVEKHWETRISTAFFSSNPEMNVFIQQNHHTSFYFPMFSQFFAVFAQKQVIFYFIGAMNFTCILALRGFKDRHVVRSWGSSPTHENNMKKPSHIGYIYIYIHGKHSLKNHGIWFLLLFLINSWWRVYLNRTHCGGPVSIQLFAAWLVNFSSKFQGYSHVVKRNDNTLSQTHQDLKCQVGLFGWAFTHIMGSFGLSNTFLCMFSPSRCDGWSRSCDQPGARCWRDRDQRPVPWSWSGTFGCESRPYFHSLHGRHCALHRAISRVARMRPTGQAGLDLVCLPLSRRALDLPTCCCCRAWSSTGSTPNCCSCCWPGTWCITCCPCWSSRHSGLWPCAPLTCWRALVSTARMHWLRQRPFCGLACRILQQLTFRPSRRDDLIVQPLQLRWRPNGIDGGLQFDLHNFSGHIPRSFSQVCNFKWHHCLLTFDAGHVTILCPILHGVQHSR